jgi:hypothetical protein
MAKIEAEVTTRHQEPFFVPSADSFFKSAIHLLINFPMLLSLHSSKAFSSRALGIDPHYVAKGEHGLLSYASHGVLASNV